MDYCGRCNGTRQVLTEAAHHWLSLSGMEQAKIQAPDPHARFMPCPDCTITIIPEDPKMPIKYVQDPVKLLLDSGLLFEINRRILHPFGLALAIECPTTDEEKEAAAKTTSVQASIWDCRDDPEGITFDMDGLIDGENKLAGTVLQNQARLEKRRELLGYVIQNMSPDQTAQNAYHAYGDSTGWKNFLGNPMPAWEDLPATIQQAWRDATKSVVEP